MRFLYVAFSVLLSTALCAKESRIERAVLVPSSPGSEDVHDAKLRESVVGHLQRACEHVHVIELVRVEVARTKNSHSDAKSELRPQVRAQNAAAAAKATIAIYADVQAIADGAVVYLQIIESGGAVRGSTTVTASAEALQTGDVERLLEGGLVQLLDSAHYTGRLNLQVDVRGAEVEVDGRKLSSSEQGWELPVGTHAIRVTHPAYHDFLRFIDVVFARPNTATVKLAAFPLTEGEMNEKRQHIVKPMLKMPWYRSWWALTSMGLVLAGATIGVVYAVRPGIPSYSGVQYHASPSP